MAVAVVDTAPPTPVITVPAAGQLISQKPAVARRADLPLEMTSIREPHKTSKVALTETKPPPVRLSFALANSMSEVVAT